MKHSHFSRSYGQLRANVTTLHLQLRGLRVLALYCLLLPFPPETGRLTPVGFVHIKTHACWLRVDQETHACHRCAANKRLHGGRYKSFVEPWAGVLFLNSISIRHKAKMSWGGFGKNPDPRKKCTLCNETCHLTSECPNQSGPAPAPAPAPAPPPPPARSYASAVATKSEAAARSAKLVAYPLDPRAAKPNPTAAPFTPRTAEPGSAAAPSVPSTAQPVTTSVPIRSTAAPSGPAAASSQESLSPYEEKHKLGHRIGYGTRNDLLPVKDQKQAPTVLTNYVRITNRPKLSTLR